MKVSKKKKLQRTVGSTEDTQLIYNYELKVNNITSLPVSKLVTPTRDTRKNKRIHDLLQLEDAKKGLHGNK